MKKMIATVTVTAFVASLSGCSTNTQDQNTAVGAGTGAVAGGLLGTIAKGAGRGWVIAGAAVVGALIGGMIGHDMDTSDHSNMNTAMDNNSVNKSSSWKNTNSGNTYNVTPTSGFFSYKGYTNCRRYVAYGMNGEGQNVKTHGIACRMDDGMWHQVK